MSASNEWTEWHLTPRGWIEGSEELDFGGGKKVATPADRVVTVKLGVKLGSGHSTKFHYYNNLVWQSSDASVVDRLVDQFGDLPQESDRYRDLLGHSWRK